jgi:GT2 family glycosyltransferase
VGSPGSGDRSARYILHRSDARPARSGWYELKLRADAAVHFLEPTLVVSHGDAEADLVEHPLPPIGATEARHLFRVDGRIVEMAIEFRAPGGAAPLPVLEIGLRRLGRVARTIEAFRLDKREALQAVGWRLAGKRLRARNRMMRLLGCLPRMAYGQWLAGRTVASGTVAGGPGCGGATVEAGPGVTVIVDLGAERLLAPRTAASLARQRPAPLEVLVVSESDFAEPSVPAGWPAAWRHIRCAPTTDAAKRLALAAKAAAGGWVLPMRNGDALAEDAIRHLLSTARAHPGAVAIYGDHDRLDAHGRRHRPAFKPQWNEPYFLAYDYIGPVVAFARSALGVAGGATQHPGLARDELLLRLARAAGNDAARSIVRVPHVLAHLGSPHDEIVAADAPSARARLVSEHLRQRGEPAEVTPQASGLLRTAWPLPKPPPRVSLIVPTRDRVDLLRPCIDGLRRGTSYPDIEILVADNGSVRPETAAFFAEIAADPRVRIVPCPGPFNFSVINNTAVRAATGSLLGFINNDIEVLAPDWLTEMAGWAARPSVGAVGAKLLYESGTIQHAGVVMGLGGLAGHAHRFYPGDHPGYANRLVVPQEVSAVTAACLVVAREKFVAAGGFDERAFPIAFNDVDLCLALRKTGWRNVWTPHAVLRHKESASRSNDMSPERRAAWELECANLRARWGDIIRADPCYTPNLTQEREDFTL